MTTGERIKMRRKEIGMSVDELAAKLDKNRATVYRYESNEIENMPITVVVPIAKALNISPAYLLGWEDTDSKKKTIAKNIQYYLVKYARSKKELCEALNIPYSTLVEWLEAKTYPPIDKVEMIANFFMLSKADLIEEQNYHRKNKEYTFFDIEDEDANTFGKYLALDSEEKEIIESLVDKLYRQKIKTIQSNPSSRETWEQISKPQQYVVRSSNNSEQVSHITTTELPNIGESEDI